MFLIIFNNFYWGGYDIMNKATTDLNKDFDIVREEILSSKLFFFFAGKLRTFKVAVLNFQLVVL